MKMYNARAIASMAADMITAKHEYTASHRSRLAAEFILDQSADGVTACAAVLSTMGALFDRGGAMVFSAETRADFYNAVLSIITENGGDGMRRHKDWIKAWYWLRDGGASSIDDVEWYAAITLQGCKSKPVSGMAAAWQLCTALRGAELVQVGELYKDGNQPDEAFKQVFNRVSKLVRAMVGETEKGLIGYTEEDSLKSWTVALKSVFSDPRVTETRKVITLYKSGDPSYAKFRLTAARMLLEITNRGVSRRPLTAAQLCYITPWMTDGNDMFRQYFDALNSALGYDFITVKGIQK